MAELDRATLKTKTTTNLSDNTSGDISAEDVRSVLEDIADSSFLSEDCSFSTLTAVSDSSADVSLPSSTTREHTVMVTASAPLSDGFIVQVEETNAQAGSKLNVVIDTQSSGSIISMLLNGINYSNTISNGNRFVFNLIFTDTWELIGSTNFTNV